MSVLNHYQSEVVDALLAVVTHPDVVTTANENFVEALFCHAFNKVPGFDVALLTKPQTAHVHGWELGQTVGGQYADVVGIDNVSTWTSGSAVLVNFEVKLRSSINAPSRGYPTQLHAYNSRSQTADQYLLVPDAARARALDADLQWFSNQSGKPAGTWNAVTLADVERALLSLGAGRACTAKGASGSGMTTMALVGARLA